MPAAVAIVSGIGALAKVGMGIAQNSKANKVVVPEANYNVSATAMDNLGLAKTMFNSAMPGSTAAAQNILANNANTRGSIGRNATDSSQALALMTGAQAQTDQSLTSLGNNDAQWRLNMLSNLNMANNGMTLENDKVYQDKVRKQNMAMAEKNNLRNSAFQNIGNGINEIGASAFAYGQAKGKI